jgi:hypothetical protein
MARLYREALETDGFTAEHKTGVSGWPEGNAPFFKLPAPPVPSPEIAEAPEAVRPVPMKSRLPRCPQKPGRKR